MMAETDPDTRRRRLRTLASADAAALARHWDAFRTTGYSTVRGPRVGQMMVRGRLGGSGPPFNIGEATVAECVVRLDDGAVGFGTVLGRDTEHARLVALFDALCQTEAAARVEEEVIAPIAEAQAGAASARAAQVAATRVDFFTMARGE